MEFWQLLTLAGTMATILGVFLTFYAMINNRTLKQESQHTREILLRMEQGQAEARKEAAEARKEAAEARKEAAEARKEAAEARNEAAEARKEIAEAIKALGELVSAEGQRTREAFRSRSA